MNADQHARSACMTLRRVYDIYGKYLRYNIAYEDLQVFGVDRAEEVLVDLRELHHDVEYGRSGTNVRDAYDEADDGDDAYDELVELIEDAIDELEYAVAG